MVPALYALVNPRDMHRAEQFFDRYGSITVFIGRLLPVVRTFIAFPAGLARCRWPNFRSIPSSAPDYRQDQEGMNILDPAIQRAYHPALGGILAIFRRKSELHVVRRPQQLCESLDYPIETSI
jgi:hypothetical protein